MSTNVEGFHYEMEEKQLVQIINISFPIAIIKIKMSFHQNHWSFIIFKKQKNINQLPFLEEYLQS